MTSPPSDLLPALTARGLTVRVGGTVLVDDLDLELVAGERVALLGASGSGKSLTAAALTASLPPGLTVTGSLVVGGEVVVPAPGRRRPAPRTALVPQDSLFALNPLVPVGRQLARPWRRRGLDARTARSRAAASLVSVGFTDADAVLRSLPAELSGGQRQRVCIAMAAACDVPVLVADEPTTALDTVTQRQVLDALRTVPAALLLITHDVAVAAELCARVLVMHRGRIVDDLATDALLAGAGGPETRRLVGAVADPSTPRTGAA